MSALCLLDLTAAFDTVNHELLLHRLSDSSVCVASCWSGSILSYLSGRTFQVMVCVVHYLHRLLSPAVVSAGSVVVHCVQTYGEAWCISTRVCRRHTGVSSLSSHRYDVSCRSTETMHCRCRRLSANRLKLNTDKIKLFWVGSRHSLSQQGCCLPVLLAVWRIW